MAALGRAVLLLCAPFSLLLGAAAGSVSLARATWICVGRALRPNVSALWKFSKGRRARQKKNPPKTAIGAWRRGFFLCFSRRARRFRICIPAYWNRSELLVNVFNAIIVFFFTKLYVIVIIWVNTSESLVLPRIDGRLSQSFFCWNREPKTQPGFFD